MKSKAWACRNSGFTLIEILVVTVILGILATIGLVSYRGIQQRAITTTLQSDLSNAAKLMEAGRDTSRMYPDILPADMRPSKGVGIELVGIESRYAGLSTVQNGVLFYDLCNEMVAEGRGNGASVSGQVGAYITACNVYGYQGMQINGWNANTFNVPLGQNTIRDWYNTNVSYDAWWSDKKTVMMNFGTELSNRFIAMGGTFPVTSFWDNWASGVQKETLPAPVSIFDPSTFCVQAHHVNYPDTYWHISAGDTQASAGACS